MLVEFDDEIIKYETLVEEFWNCHDPTTLDRQGPDFGRQYRSVIYYFTNEQKKIAIQSKEKNQYNFKNRIVTEITKAEVFYQAEEYHQNYILKRKS